MGARHTLPFFLLAALGFVDSASAQPYWTRHVGSLGNDHVSDVKVDESGAIYITGEFSGTADIADEQHTVAGGLDFFVAKLNAEGAVVWWQQGGGYGLDRGTKLAFGPDNTLAVVGEFQGEAVFQGISITSTNATPDMFVAVLDRGTGVQQWIQHGGGGMGADRPYGVTVAPNGQVTVVGEFQGPATWDGQSLSSVPDPDTQIPTMDVVIASYSSTGTLLWLQQGAADHTDRAIDVANDGAGNIYVAGQFSDTITFDATHLNAMYNATFILKLDVAGNEQWFRRCGGATFDHVRDLLMTPGGELLLAGDLQGTMIFDDAQPDLIAGEQPYNYYLLRVSTDGELTASGQIGSSNGLSARGIALRDDTIVVAGQFNCVFTALNAFYGPGQYMAAGSEDIFVSKHRLSDLGFIAARHYGGEGSKLAGQVAILPGGDPVLCGSYTGSVSFAALYDELVEVDDFFGSSGYASATYMGWDCPAADQRYYATQDARGLKDGLIAKAWSEDSVVYDWWEYPQGDCVAPPIGWICAAGNGWDFGDECLDTLVRCGHAAIEAGLTFAFTMRDDDGEIPNSTGPLVDVLWSTGDTTLGINAYSTGWYSVQVTAANGCWAWSDSLYVIVNPLPPVPLISDDVVVNIGESHPADIILCDPDSALIWCANADPSTTRYWVHWAYGSEADTVWADTAVADTTGYWTFYMVTAAGCVTGTDLDVYDHTATPLDSLELEATITFPLDTAGTDSIWLCEGSLLFYHVDLQWWLDGQSTVPPGTLLFERNVNGQGWSNFNDPSGWNGLLSDLSTGWYNLDIQVRVRNAPCGSDTLLFAFSEQVWIGLWPSIVPDISVTGPATMCVGDSALLVATCANCTSIQWCCSLGTADSVWVHVAGSYDVYGIVDDAHGCSWDENAGHTVIHPPGPLLLTLPPDGIICPDDSAHVYTTTQGTDQVWYTPYGPVANNSPDIWAWVAGEYYLTMTDPQGCHLTSDPVLLTGYGTPYLNVTPDNVLCLTGDEVIIQVVTTVPSGIVWAPPLSGSSLMQTVTEPGTYSVSATACGITTPMSVTVTASNVQAALTEPGPFTICGGEPVQLTAQPGAAVYIWQPGEVYGPTITVYAPGEYTLLVYDDNGCVAESAPITVTAFDLQQPLYAVGDTLCTGETAILTPQGSGSINWYADPGMQQPLYTGGPFSPPGLTGDTVFYVTQTEGPCVTDPQAVTVIVDDPPGAVTITAPQTVCQGAEATILLDAQPGVEALWTTPGGTASGTTLIIEGFAAGDAGTYTAIPFNGYCPGVPVSVDIALNVPIPFSLGPDTTYCLGSSIILGIPAWYTAPQWSTGDEGYFIQVSTDGIVTAQAVDSNGCFVQAQAQVTGEECPTLFPNVVTPNADGQNDQFVIHARPGSVFTLRIFDRWGRKVWEGTGQTVRWNGHHQSGEALPMGVYYYEVIETRDGEVIPRTGYIHLAR